MEPIHIVTDKNNIGELVLMPGDPLRAKYIADNFLENAKLINEVRNMLGFTGTYKGKVVSVMSSGMGIPSIGIYAHELVKFYGVKKIIRIGSAGSLDPKVHMRDIVVAEDARSLSTFALAASQDESHIKYASKDLIEDIKSVDSNAVIHYGSILTSDTFDPYTGGIDEVLNILDFKDPLASEMEAFGLYHIGEITNTKVAAMLTIVDSKFENVNLTSEERQTSLNDMIMLALEAIIK